MFYLFLCLDLEKVWGPSADIFGTKNRHWLRIPKNRKKFFLLCVAYFTVRISKNKFVGSLIVYTVPKTKFLVSLERDIGNLDSNPIFQVNQIRILSKIELASTN